MCVCVCVCVCLSVCVYVGHPSSLSRFFIDSNRISKHTHKLTHTKIHTHTHTDTHSHRHSATQTHRHTDIIDTHSQI